jgi:hypothetical protein
MASPRASSQTSKAPPASRKFAAAVFALLGLTALGISAYYGYQRYRKEHPQPLPHVIAPIPKNQEEFVRNGMRFVGTQVLDLTPDQGKKLGKIWQHLPRSVDELVDFQKRTDDILTTGQRERLRPIQKTLRHQVVDRMLEPTKGRFATGDFEKMKDEVKRRVDHRVDGQR